MFTSFYDSKGSTISHHVLTYMVQQSRICKWICWIYSLYYFNLYKVIISIAQLCYVNCMWFNGFLLIQVEWSWLEHSLLLVLTIYMYTNHTLLIVWSKTKLRANLARQSTWFRSQKYVIYELDENSETLLWFTYCFLVWFWHQIHQKPTENQ